MDSANDREPESTPETGPKLLTKAIVERRIEYGEYYVAHDTASKSEAYLYIQKVFEQNTGLAVLYWFYCPYCHDVFYQNVSVGTTPLLRHLRNVCKSIPTVIRQKLLASQKEKPPSKRDNSSQQQPGNSLEKRFEPPTIDLMAKALSEATKIGALFGQTIDSETYKRLLMDSSTW